jgi:hypothetical protein
LFRLMEEDELEDQAQTVTRMAINAYARLRGVAPQRVHYYIRNKRLQKYRCDCGRFVVDIAEADKVIGVKSGQTDEACD